MGDAELKEYAKIIQEFLNAIPSEYDFLFARYRLYLNKPFFDHLGYLIVSAQNSGASKESEMLCVLGTKIIATLEVYDSIINEKKTLKKAFDLLLDLLASTSSLDSAEKKIDDLTIAGLVDISFAFIISKAYSSVKESFYTNTEIAYVMMNIYFKVQELLANNKSIEIRILKYLLTLEDPMIIENELNRALTKAQKTETESHEYLFTTRERLLDTIDAIIQSYVKSKTWLARIPQASKETPPVVQRLITYRKILIVNN